MLRRLPTALSFLGGRGVLPSRLHVRTFSSTEAIPKLGSADKVQSLVAKLNQSLKKRSILTINKDPKEQKLASGTTVSKASTSSTSANGFASLGLSDEILKALEAQEITVPTPVQAKVITRILSGENLVMAASTGSGKTLAYTLPCIQALHAQEQLGYVRRPRRPRVLVLVPTRELARQVLDSVKNIGHFSKVASTAVLGGEQYGQQKIQLDRLVDVVVASPGRLMQHKQQGNAVKALLDDVKGGFNLEFSDPSNATPRNAKLEDQRVKINVVEVDGVHRSLPNVQHVFETAARDKLVTLRDVLARHRSKNMRTLIFCNTVQSCHAVEYAINQDAVAGGSFSGEGDGGNDEIHATSYHGELNSIERAKNLEKFRSGEEQYMVCSDIAARGLDIPETAHVVMFDFPLNPVDYLHRAGRCGRAGRKGLVTALVAKRDQVLAEAIEKAISKGLPIDALSSDKKDYTGTGRLVRAFKAPRQLETPEERTRRQNRLEYNISRSKATKLEAESASTGKSSSTRSGSDGARGRGGEMEQRGRSPSRESEGQRGRRPDANSGGRSGARTRSPVTSAEGRSSRGLSRNTERGISRSQPRG
eukprot:gene20912-23745_t